MSLAKFLVELFAGGRVIVRAPTEFTDEELSAAALVLVEQDRVARLNLSVGIPPLDSSAALQSASLFYRASQLALFRNLGEGEIEKLSKCQVDNWDQAEVHYSVDLTFR